MKFEVFYVSEPRRVEGNRGNYEFDVFARTERDTVGFTFAADAVLLACGVEAKHSFQILSASMLVRCVDGLEWEVA